MVKMTQQYVAGELSLRLGRLQAVATDQERACEVARLRYEAERMPRAALGSVVVRALGLADRLCWDSLECGDPLAFSREAAIGADLWEFGICARLFEEDLEVG
ncbi:MAG: hypothetical protein ACREM3_20335 [Candidatus Rokuibacteriota bacterium]